MQSELELQETLEEMQVLAANPELYPLLAEQQRPISLLLGLLAHENTDISLSVIDLLHELLESNCLQEAGLNKVNPLLEVLFSGQLIQSIIQNISRLDETKKDEADGVHKTLGIIESLLEIRPDMNVTMANQGLFAWLLRRLQKRPIYDKNKLYVSELLSILLQMDEMNRRQLGEVDGIDILLQQLSVYKRHDPTSQEEIELMLNLFDCLCSALMLPENKDRFLKGEGIQLMNLMLRIISALLRYSPPETFKSRVLAKFVENDHEKVDRLIELHLKYLDIVKATNHKVELMRKNEKKWIGYTREEIEMELMLKRLEGGLLPLQVLDVIILDVCVNGAPTILERVLHLLKMRSISVNSVLQTVQEYVNNLGDDSTTTTTTTSSSSTTLSEKTRVTDLLKRFKEMC
ncbi:unnamed protein product [Schistosoma turkestanicum]|nr:unnamed protein product [Schistosoma turkestanicum]